MRLFESFEQGAWPRDIPAGFVDSLLDEGITVIALDVEPGGVLGASAQARYKALLVRCLGEPVDYGPLLAWWLDPSEDVPAGLADGDGWRAGLAEWKRSHPERPRDTLMKSSRWIKERAGAMSDPGHAVPEG